MSYSQRIPEAQWEEQRDRIYTMYVDEDEKLDRVIERMAQEHDFHASRPQYIRRITVVWKMRKNSTKEEWQLAKSLVRKRKAEGKDTRLSMNGKFVDSKKMKKELRRYQEPQSEKPLSTSVDVTACTPPGPQLATKIITMATMPFFRFQNGFDALKLTSRAFQVSTLSTASSSSDLSSFLVSSCQDTLFRAMPPHLPPVKLLFDKTIPEQTHERNGCDIQRLIPSEPWMRLFQQLIFMSANNTLAQDQLDEFLQSVMGAGHEVIAALEQTILIEGPTTEIFALRLLHSAIGVEGEESLDLVQFLLRKRSREKNVHQPILPLEEEALLCVAIRHHNIRAVQLLLNYGANSNVNWSREYSFSALGLALEAPSTSAIAKMLIEAGADVNPPFGCRPISPLMQATRNQDMARVKQLLKAGANPNYTSDEISSALHIAIQSDDLEIVKVLLEGGADPDVLCNKVFVDKELRFPIRGWLNSYYLWTPGRDITKRLELSPPIRVATARENIPVVKTLIDGGANMDGFFDPFPYLDSDDLGTDDLDKLEVVAQTALQHAVRTCQVYAVEFLLTMGARVEATHPLFSTALQQACGLDKSIVGKHRVVEILLDWGADLNAPACERRGRTALQAAAQSGDFYLVEDLLRRGSEVNAPPAPNGGRTALQAAAESGNIEVVNLLLKNGANPNTAAATKGGRTCIEASAFSGNTVLLEIMLKLGNNADAPRVSENLAQGLKAAVTSGSVEEVRRLLDAGAGVNIDTNVRLCDAVWRKSHEIFDLLMSYGVDPDSIKADPSPLWAAVHQGDEYMVNRLVKAGAALDKLSYHWCCDDRNECYGASLERITGLIYDELRSETPLVAAVMSRDINLTKVLLGAGANPNGISQNCSPLLLALWDIKRFDPLMEFAQLLLDNGADPHARDSNGNAIHHLLLRAEYWDDATDHMLRLLLRCKVDVNADSVFGTPIQMLFDDPRCVAIARLLLEAGADVNAPPCGENIWTLTALQNAALIGHQELVNELLAAGADLHAPAFPKAGRTALQAASSVGNLGLVEHLVSLGVDVNELPAENRGATALQLAVMHGHYDIAIFLLERGARINAPAAPINGCTALQGAAEQGRLDMVHIFLENDEEPETLEERCEYAARLAESGGHVVIARILKEWKKL
ncbi:hypothetical protein NM208_g881 [Fusarium decemcellulare]|uniref:Uncharacterized protein n=2 Tax=Fusarium decemcellulare TaxID=57161 RepID=A0ACC1SQN9_9HYPO|nr:hypothetical protein NM208_g3031 [Fusarium decemcellulare]KAJ3548694.1 hypothetical protein NM208_g881 [Fusarium decemcellulare]